MTILERLRAHSGFVLTTMAIVAAFFGGYIAHRPAMVVKEATKDSDQKSSTTTVVQKVDLTELKSFVLDAVQTAMRSVDQKRNIVHTVTKTPNGDVVDQTVDKSETTTQSQTTTQSHTDETDQVSATIAKQFSILEQELHTHETVVERIPLPPPNKWLLSVGAGVSIPALFGQSTTNYLPVLPRQLIIDASLDRRILGPLYAGVAANTQGVVGLHLRLGFGQ